MINKCLICYGGLDNNEKDYHEHCSEKLWGKSKFPEINFNLADIDELAKKTINTKLSIPGVQKKLSLHLSKVNQNNRLTIVGIEGNYILKPPSNLYTKMPEVEDLTMKLASMYGIETAKHCLVRLKSGELAYLTERFDRVNGEMVHQEDMCQLAGNLTENKYRGSMEKIAKVIKSYVTNIGLDLNKFFELVLFSYVSGNSDMHLKNFSLQIFDKNNIRLSPAYDLLSTKLLIHDDEEDLALTMLGKKSNFKKNDFEDFADQINIQKKIVDNSFNKLIEAKNKFISMVETSFVSDDQKTLLTGILKKRISMFEAY